MDKKAKQLLDQGKLLLLFDDQCILCNRTVQFFIKIDKKHRIAFIGNQSEYATLLIQAVGLDTELNASTIIAIDPSGRSFQQSDASIEALKVVGGIWSGLGYAMTLVPKTIRDFFYKIIAKNRYQWFGRTEYCLIPDQELKQRLLG